MSNKVTYVFENAQTRSISNVQLINPFEDPFKNDPRYTYNMMLLYHMRNFINTCDLVSNKDDAEVNESILKIAKQLKLIEKSKIALVKPKNKN